MATKKIIIAIFILLPSPVLSQKEIVSGIYDGLNLAFDKNSKLVTGYFENSTDWDDESENTTFNCSFYFIGSLTTTPIEIKTFHPLHGEGDTILGTLQVMDSKKISIKLNNEHGGCWNVQHFAVQPVEFILVEPKRWIQIRFVKDEKIYFYSTESEAYKLNSFLLKGDIVYIDKIDKEWAFGSYFGKIITKGWLKVSEINEYKK